VAAISAARCRLNSVAFARIASSRTRSFTSSSGGTRGSSFPVTVMKTGPRGELIAPLTAPSASVNASCATAGAPPRPGIGSSRVKKPDSCTV
jgi:hypothetical protein